MGDALGRHAAALLAAAERDLGERADLARTKTGAAHVALTRSFAIYLGEDEAARSRLAREAALLDWAAGQEIAVPQVVELTADRLVTRRVAADEQRGAAFVAAAVAAADSVARATPPAPALLQTSSSRRAPRRTVLVRAARMARSPLSLAEFRRARAGLGRLHDSTLAHGDFHPRNLLYDSAAGVVRLVDWATVGPGPAGADLLSLLPQLPHPDDRAALLAAVRARVADEQHLAALRHWMAVRYVADLVTGRPRRRWQQERIGPALDRMAESRPGS